MPKTERRARRLGYIDADLAWKGVFRDEIVPLLLCGFVALHQQRDEWGEPLLSFWEFDHEFDATVDFLAAGLERDEVCVLSLRQDAANARVLAGLERGIRTDAWPGILPFLT